MQEANLALEEERQHLRGLFEQAPGFMAVLSGPQHVFGMANAAYHRLVGHRDILGKPVREALPEVVEQGFVELLDRVHATGQPFVGRSIRVLLEREPGEPSEERYVDFVYQPIIGPGGATSGIFVQGHDVTEQKRAEEALRDSERKFRSMAEAMPQVVWTARPDGYRDYYNSRWFELTGLCFEESKAEGWVAALHPEDRERGREAWRRSVATGTRYEIEYRFRSKEGPYRWYIGRALPVRNEQGEIERWFGTCTDIHELKQAQEELRRSQERAIEAQAEAHRLAGMLACRVAELDAANEEMQRFAYIVSHDLRAPLVNIMGFTAELEGVQEQIEHLYRAAAWWNPDLVTPEIRVAIEEDLTEAIRFIRTSCSRMDRLISAILKLSREGRRVLTAERIDMRQLLENQRQVLAHQLSERGTELVIESVPDLTSDRLAVEQIFGNLIENAVKYLAPRPARPDRGERAGVGAGSPLRGHGQRARHRFEGFRPHLRVVPPRRGPGPARRGNRACPCTGPGATAWRHRLGRVAPGRRLDLHRDAAQDIRRGFGNRLAWQRRRLRMPQAPAIPHPAVRRILSGPPTGSPRRCGASRRSRPGRSRNPDARD